MSMLSCSSWLFPRPSGFRSPGPKGRQSQTPASSSITTAASLRVGQILRLGVKSHFENLGRLDHGPRLRDSLAAVNWARFCSFGGEDSVEKRGFSKPDVSGPGPLDGRPWTNAILALNILVYIAQVATQGKLMFWGAKINGLVENGELWRLVTCAFLHANVGHLLVNCYSLNAVGPSVEKISGPRRYLAIYLASSIASSTMSYYFSNDPSVGASGAIFGLVGSMAVFILRHRGQIGGGKRELTHIANVIAINMVIGLLSEGIDNWGHVGGLLGGAAASWLVGPAWDIKSPSMDGRTRFNDRAPIFNLINWNKRS